MADLTFFVFLVADGALAGSIYALVALAFVVVYKASRMINFAVGNPPWLRYPSGAGNHGPAAGHGGRSVTDNPARRGPRSLLEPRGRRNRSAGWSRVLGPLGGA